MKTARHTVVAYYRFPVEFHGYRTSMKYYCAMGMNINMESRLNIIN